MPLAVSQDCRHGHDVFVDYFRCPESFGALRAAQKPSAEPGYFAFGEAVAFGRLCCDGVNASPQGHLHDASQEVTFSAEGLCLPFDINDVVTNLRQERYPQPAGNYLGRMTATRAIQHLYYFMRPALPVEIRRHLQRVRLSGWEEIAFPRWPVDTSVDSLMRTTLGLMLRKTGIRAIPFVWFWPDGAPSCAVMTHDVEGPLGGSLCETLMDLDDSFGMKSAFQIVPEMRGHPTRSLVENVRKRGFEVNLHDLNHDGYLFHNRRQFLQRAAQINQYTRALECHGFRSGAMYREQQWFDAFEFSYDMSVPNVAHLEPQRGGCCTIMPYFVGKLLELPLTTTQDYSLFHIIADYSIRLWKQQIDLIRAANGFISFITHPDYSLEKRARAVYSDLLAHLQGLRDRGEIWMTVPGEVDRWWRNRQQMTLVPHGRTWRIVGPDSHRARLAYASVDGNHVVYSLDTAA